MSGLVVHMTTEECIARRDTALKKLGMTLDEARAQWEECGCCLRNGNWHDLENLHIVSDMNYLLEDDE